MCPQEILQTKNKEKQKRYAEKRKNDNKICHTSKRKKYNLAQSCESSNVEKSYKKKNM